MDEKPGIVKFTPHSTSRSAMLIAVAVTVGVQVALCAVLVAIHLQDMWFPSVQGGEVEMTFVSPSEEVSQEMEEVQPTSVVPVAAPSTVSPVPEIASDEDLLAMKLPENEDCSEMKDFLLDEAPSELLPEELAAMRISMNEVKRRQPVKRPAVSLSQTPGVFTLDGGGTWQRGSVSNTVIRGMNKDTYTLTMVDGMRISDANMSGNKLLGITNLFTVGNVEVVKGAQGAVFGSGAIGGVVAMDTPEGEGDPVTRIFAEAGSFGSFNSYVTSSGKIKKLSYFVGVGFETTENDPSIYPAIYDNRTGMNDFRQWQEAVRLGYDINDKVKVSFTYRRLDSYFEYPTPYVDYNQWPSVPDPHLYNTEDKNRSNLVTGRVDAEISKLWSTSFKIGRAHV